MTRLKGKVKWVLKAYDVKSILITKVVIRTTKIIHKYKYWLLTRLNPYG